MAEYKFITPHGNALDVSGATFGRLTAIGPVARCTTGVKWLCICECGTETLVFIGNLRKRHTTSCGCYAIDTRTSHGKSNNEIYDVWISMHNRCNNPDNLHYKEYGGRGIKVCDEWSDVSRFIADMGRRPSNLHSIDRIDNDGDYTPDNCRWATKRQQANNRRNGKWLTFRGETMTVSQWSRRLDIYVHTIHQRLRRGWSDEKALSTPVRMENKKR